MKFINQNDYPHISYPTNAQEPASKQYLEGSIKSSGCGLCCLCMAVDQLTMQQLELEEIRDISIEQRANLKVGTDMKILGPYVAARFGLEYQTSDDDTEMIETLKNGGVAIINTGGNRADYSSAFCHVGHFMLAIAYHDGYVRILDPDYKISKYEGNDRVIDKKGVLYAKVEVIHADSDNRTPRYYLFNC